MLNRLTLIDLRKQLTNLSITASTALEFYLSRIEQYEDVYGAFVEVYADEARARAYALDRRISRGERPGILHGVPVALKDVIDIRGRRTGCGSGPWRTEKALNHAWIVERLEKAGAVIVGKTQTVELALGAWGTNSIVGTPRNPWDLVEHRAPGGSSSGSAVAVSAGLVPCAFGTDTGGSIRVPAAWCGVSGLKTSIDSINMRGVVPLSRTLDTIGPIARNIEDLALVWAAVAQPNLISSFDAFTREFTQMHLSDVRVARLSDQDLCTVHNDIRSAYEESLEILQREGAQVVSMELAASFADISSLNSTILFFEGFASYGELAINNTLKLDDDVRARLLEGKNITTVEYESALAQRQLLLQKFNEQFRGVNALLTPTTEIPAPKLQHIDQKDAPSMFTRFANFLGFCALAVPNGFSATGLPTSLQIIGPQGAEWDLLRIGKAFQSLTSWNEKYPPNPMMIS